MNKNLASVAGFKITGSYQRSPMRPHFKQRGMSLIELMVGIVIGLFVLAVAISALMVSRGVSGTVKDASAIQQQSAYAMRVIGTQTRQAGSLYLNLNSSNAATENMLTAPVAFEEQSSDFNPINAISGADAGTGNQLVAAYRNYVVPSYDSTATELRNCLGEQGTATLVKSDFVYDPATFELRCGATANTTQPILQNVANFEMRYLVQSNATPGTPTIAYAAAADVPATDWPKVQAVEVCLVLFGDEVIDMTPPVTDTDRNGSYLDCDGTTRKNMTTLPGVRAKRMHIAYRNVFQLRSQGVVGTAL